MRRKLFTAVAVASAVLCVAVCVVWVRSYWVEDSYQSIDGRLGPDGFYDRTFSAWSENGGVGLMLDRTHFVPRFIELASAYQIGTFSGFDRRPARPAAYPVSGPPDLGFKWRGIHFGWSFQPTPAGYESHWGATIPHGMFALALAIAPLARVFAWRRRVRLIRRGRCLRCGYDLRATPERCPECGAVPPAASQKPVA